MSPHRPKSISPNDNAATIIIMEEEVYFMNEKLTIRPEEHRDYKSIVSLILRSFREGTDYSDGSDIIALVEEIRDSEYYGNTA